MAPMVGTAQETRRIAFLPVIVVLWSMSTWVRHGCTMAWGSGEDWNLVYGRGVSVLTPVNVIFGFCYTIKAESAAVTLKEDFSNGSQKEILTPQHCSSGWEYITASWGR